MRDAARGKVDKTFFLIIGILVVFGLVILTSASSPVGYERFGDSYYFLKHQLVSGLLPGIVALVFTYLTPYQLYRKWALPMLGISILLLILVFIPGVGADYGTFAKSWVSIAGVAFQPAELVKLTFLIYLAAWMEKRQSELHDVHSGFVPFIVILAVIGLLMLLQPDLGTLSIITAMALSVYFIAGGPLHYLLGLGVAGTVALGVAIQSSPYRAARFMTFLHPELDPQGIGYQINQALLAIGSGGFFGRGYGHSLQKFQYLPEVAGDSIFAVMSEELGFLFTSLFLVGYVAMLWQGLKIAEKSHDDFGKFLVVGIIAWFGFQAFINIGAMIGLLPITGVPLPFLSYGGTSLVVSLAAVGIVLNISRYSKEV